MGLLTTVLEGILLYNPDIPEFPWEFGSQHLRLSQQMAPQYQLDP